MKPQQFRKLTEIKIQVLYLIVNVIHFHQGKDFLLSFFFFSHSSSWLPLSCIFLCLWLCPLSLSVICCLYFSASICLLSAVSISLLLFVSLSLFLSLPHCVFLVCLSLSLLNSIKKSYQSHQFGYFYDRWEETGWYFSIYDLEKLLVFIIIFF